VFGVNGAVCLAIVTPPQATRRRVRLIDQFLSIRLLRQTIKYEIRWPLILAGLFGVPFGTFALMWCDPRVIRLGLAALLVICGVWQLTGGRLRGFRDALGCDAYAAGYRPTQQQA
jgi:uncharacterized membrane protein YfcA